MLFVVRTFVRPHGAKALTFTDNFFADFWQLAI